MSKAKPLVLVTGGPTKAFLDKVRFLSNVSTGQLCFEICRQLKEKGYPVVSVVGANALPFEELRLKKLIRVETNEEMRQAVLKVCRSERPAAGIFSAAVLDFVPANVITKKVSSSKSSWVVRLKPAPKILDEVDAKYPRVAKFGFKLESEKKRGPALQKFALSYLKRKNLRALCLNFLDEVGSKAHRAYLFDNQGKLTVAKTKKQIATWFAQQLLQL